MRCPGIVPGFLRDSAQRCDASIEGSDDVLDSLPKDQPTSFSSNPPTSSSSYITQGEETLHHYSSGSYNLPVAAHFVNVSQDYAQNSLGIPDLIPVHCQEGATVAPQVPRVASYDDFMGDHNTQEIDTTRNLVQSPSSIYSWITDCSETEESVPKGPVIANFVPNSKVKHIQGLSLQNPSRSNDLQNLDANRNMVKSDSSFFGWHSDSSNSVSSFKGSSVQQDFLDATQDTQEPSLQTLSRYDPSVGAQGINFIRNGFEHAGYDPFVGEQSIHVLKNSTEHVGCEPFLGVHGPSILNFTEHTGNDHSEGAQGTNIFKEHTGALGLSHSCSSPSLQGRILENPATPALQHQSASTTHPRSTPKYDASSQDTSVTTVFGTPVEHKKSSPRQEDNHSSAQTNKRAVSHTGLYAFESLLSPGYEREATNIEIPPKRVNIENGFLGHQVEPHTNRNTSLPIRSEACYSDNCHQCPKCTCAYVTKKMLVRHLKDVHYSPSEFLASFQRN